MANEAKNDNKEATLLEEGLFVATLLQDDQFIQAEDLSETREQPIMQPTVDSSIADKIRNHLVNDDIAMQVKRAKSSTTTPYPFKSTAAHWTETKRLLFYHDRCYIPANLDLRRHIIKMYHDSPSVGHPGQWKTGELIRRDYFWPSIQTFISNYV